MFNIPKLYAFSAFLCLMLLAAGAGHAAGSGEEYKIEGFLRPPGLSFPIVFYLSMDHPGPQKAMFESKAHTMAPGLDPDEEIDLPIYMGYLVVDNSTGPLSFPKTANIRPPTIWLMPSCSRTISSKKRRGAKYAPKKPLLSARIRAHGMRCGCC